MWFRSDRNAWYITLGGRQHNLGPDEKVARVEVTHLKLEHLQKTEVRP
jgi:hypothetical protein